MDMDRWTLLATISKGFGLKVGILFWLPKWPFNWPFVTIWHSRVSSLRLHQYRCWILWMVIVAINVLPRSEMFKQTIPCPQYRHSSWKCTILHENVHLSANHSSAFLSRRAAIGWELYFFMPNSYTFRNFDGKPSRNYLLLRAICDGCSTVFVSKCLYQSEIHIEIF